MNDNGFVDVQWATIGELPTDAIVVAPSWGIGSRQDWRALERAARQCGRRETLYQAVDAQRQDLEARGIRYSSTVITRIVTGGQAHDFVNDCGTRLQLGDTNGRCDCIQMGLALGKQGNGRVNPESEIVWFDGDVAFNDAEDTTPQDDLWIRTGAEPDPGELARWLTRTCAPVYFGPDHDTPRTQIRDFETVVLASVANRLLTPETALGTIIQHLVGTAAGRIKMPAGEVTVRVSTDGPKRTIEITRTATADERERRE